MKKNVLFVVLCAIALGACVKEEIVENGDSAGSRIVFTAKTEAASRTMLSGNDSDGYDVLWQSGDSITVVDGALHAGVYTTTSTTTRGEFTYARGTEANTPDYKAYYPASIYNGGTPTLPDTQAYTEGNIAQSPMYAESSTPSLSFTNLCGILRLRITTSQGTQNVRYITVSADEPMSGAFSFSENAAVISSGTAGVTLDCGPSGTAIGSEAKDFYIAVPANTYSNLKITVTTSSFAQQTKTANKAIVVSRSQITPVSLGFNNLEVAYTNLSALETANSYIVGEAGAYKFKANVAGNGVASLSGVSLGIGPISSADLLWATLGTEIVPSSSELIQNVSYENGYVYFVTGREFREGNALIAVRDASSNILWSWHIWFESDDLEAMAQKYWNGDSHILMDRNLGATSNCYSEDNFFDAGLYYEWGRKDPFTGVVSRSSSATRVAKKGSATTTNVVSMDIAGSIARPTDLSSGGISGATWDTAAKNIFDPCPPGWRVPSTDAFSHVTGEFPWESGKGSSLSKWWDKTYKYWFPAAGAQGHGNYNFFKDVGDASYVYTTTSAYSRSFDISSSIKGSMQAKDSYWACSVRCLKEAVEDLSAYKDLSLAGTYLNTDGGTANCYIIKPSANEHYKFPATVRGNGRADLGGISRNIPEGQIASAEIVWSSLGTTTAPAEGDLITGLKYKNGYVYFSIPYGASQKTGNVVVAVKDGAGNILWSWHLWKGGTANAQTFASGAIFMDRNLGALATRSAAVSEGTSQDYGLLFQWGRKDPFLNAPNRDTYTATEAAVLGASIESRNELFTVAQTIQNPTAFPFTYNDTPWMVDGQKNIALWDSEKTIFDPCPPGWKVPAKASWGDAFLTSWSTSAKKDGGYTVSHNGIFSGVDMSDTGFRQGVRTEKNSSVYIQGQGIIQHRGDGIGYYRFWCSDGILWRDSFNGTDRIGLFDYDVNLDPTYFYYGTWRDNACSVRCVKE